MNGLCHPKTLLLVLLISEAVFSAPAPKSRRKRRPHSHNNRSNLLQVYNFSESALGTPTNSRTHVLWSRNGLVYLQANRNLTPGTNSTRGPRAEFTGEVMAQGIVRLKSVASNRYLAINQRGRLLLQRNPNDDCLFHQENAHGFTTYSSYKYYKKTRWDTFIAVKLNGDIKSPLLTERNQKAILFNSW